MDFTKCTQIILWLNYCEIQHYMQGFSSQYRGVCWVKSRERWKAEIFFKSQHNVSYYLNEDDAARKVNKWCDEFKIEQKNPDIDSTQNVDVIIM